MQNYLKLIAGVISGLCLFVAMVLFAGLFIDLHARMIETLLLIVSGLCIYITFRPPALPAEWRQYFEQHYTKLTHLPARQLMIMVVVSSAVSLLLQLIMVRWQGTLFPFFAFYKNYSMLSCFLGLGIGYALAGKVKIPLQISLFLVLLQVVAALLLRYATHDDIVNLLFVLPFVEITNIATPFLNWGSYFFALPVIAFMLLLFVLTVCCFVPLGIWCGEAMSPLPRLSAYGLNLLGSIAGCLILVALSYAWTPPPIWFAISLLPLILYLPSSLTRFAKLAMTAFALVLMAVCWPVETENHHIYSPYQLVERTGNQYGLMEILSAGKYYQRVFDLSDPQRVEKSQHLTKVAGYYELPFQFRDTPGEVVIVGAGTGNDVAAALRAGAQRVVAVEIDPVILGMGARYHPEQPYSQKNVQAVIDDARTFFRQTKEQFDMVVYGVLDSHTLLSQASSVRIDSYVYTQEGLNEAFSRLRDGGVMSLSFALPKEEIGYKIYHMMKNLAAYGAGEPLVLRSGYDGTTVTYIVGKKLDISLPPSLTAIGFEDQTASYQSLRLNVDIPTDDWPFFYMPKRVYPVSYVIFAVMIIACSAVIIHQLVGLSRLQRNYLPFFFLGAGFMLVETKAITELGLLFGNTWYVVAITIIAILSMAFAANALIARMGRVVTPGLAFAGLIALIAITYWLIRYQQAAFDTDVMSWFYVLLLTAPIFFSGLLFSRLLQAQEGDVSSALAYNLVGAMLGGLLEYNAMYFGYAALYPLAIGIYLLAFLFMPRRAG